MVFFLYLAVLVYVLFFSARFGRTQGSIHGVNLTPFAEISRYWKGSEGLTDSMFWLNIGGNIAAFLPLGFFVPLLTRTRWYGVFTMAIVYVASLGAELLQYALNIGSFDIDDILLNTLGGLLGVLLFACVNSHLAEEDE